MGRDASFYDEAFGRKAYDPDDQGDFVPNSVFVIMAFNPETEDTYRVIKESCAALGLRAQRADDSPGSGVVLGQITRQIEDAEFLVVDLTLARPNEYRLIRRQDDDG